MIFRRSLILAAATSAISAEAKVLYGLLLDRMSLSSKNGWLDKDGRVFIIFTVEDIMDALGCATQKAMEPHRQCKHKCNDTRRLKWSGITPKYTFRYADDWVVLTSTKQEAVRLKKELAKYFKNRMKLELTGGNKPGDTLLHKCQDLHIFSML